MSIHRYAALALLAVAGCGQSGPKTHAVAGSVSLAGGDPTQLAGHYVEAALTTDPTVRASGVIGPDGRFKLETLADGRIQTGAPEGTYGVRLILSDDDGVKGPKVSPRYLRFETSGLSIQVPAKDDVKLEVGPR
jgi:hypothetical protein